MQKCGDRGRELAFSLSTPTHHPYTVSPFFIVAVGAEESSVKDGEIFNDLSELTRFEAEGKGGRERGRQGPEKLHPAEGCLLKSGGFTGKGEHRDVVLVCVLNGTKWTW